MTLRRLTGLSIPFVMIACLCFRSWNWECFRQFGDRLCSQPLPEAAALLLCYPGLCPLRGYGSVLLDDGFPPPLRLLTRAGIRCRMTESASFVLSVAASIIVLCDVAASLGPKTARGNTRIERKDVSLRSVGQDFVREVRCSQSPSDVNVVHSRKWYHTS